MSLSKLHAAHAQMGRDLLDLARHPDSAMDVVAPVLTSYMTAMASHALAPFARGARGPVFLLLAPPLLGAAAGVVMSLPTLPQGLNRFASVLEQTMFAGSLTGFGVGLKLLFMRSTALENAFSVSAIGAGVGMIMESAQHLTNGRVPSISGIAIESLAAACGTLTGWRAAQTGIQLGLQTFIADLGIAYLTYISRFAAGTPTGHFGLILSQNIIAGATTLPFHLGPTTRLSPASEGLWARLAAFIPRLKLDIEPSADGSAIIRWRWHRPPLHQDTHRSHWSTQTKVDELRPAPHRMDDASEISNRSNPSTLDASLSKTYIQLTPHVITHIRERWQTYDAAFACRPAADRLALLEEAHPQRFRSSLSFELWQGRAIVYKLHQIYEKMEIRNRWLLEEVAFRDNNPSRSLQLPKPDESVEVMYGDLIRTWQGKLLDLAPLSIEECDLLHYAHQRWMRLYVDAKRDLHAQSTAVADTIPQHRRETTITLISAGLDPYTNPYGAMVEALHYGTRAFHERVPAPYSKTRGSMSWRLPIDLWAVDIPIAQLPTVMSGYRGQLRAEDTIEGWSPRYMVPSRDLALEQYNLRRIGTIEDCMRVRFDASPQQPIELYGHLPVLEMHTDIPAFDYRGLLHHAKTTNRLPLEAQRHVVIDPGTVWELPAEMIYPSGIFPGAFRYPLHEWEEMIQTHAQADWSAVDRRGTTDRLKETMTRLREQSALLEVDYT